MAPARRRGVNNKAKDKSQMSLGDLVLAKVKGFPAWPAKISKPEDWKQSPDPKKYFVEFFGTQEILKLDGLGFESIGPHDVSWLERPFVEAEVHDVVRRMVKDKALDPDGFSMGFFQIDWEVVNEDLMKVFQEMFSVGKFENSLNATFIALIPKKVGASEGKEFRPISLGEVLGKIITKSQNAFVRALSLD